MKGPCLGVDAVSHPLQLCLSVCYDVGAALCLQVPWGGVSNPTMILSWDCELVFQVHTSVPFSNGQ
jgi:hypothetical protein